MSRGQGLRASKSISNANKRSSFESLESRQLMSTTGSLHLQAGNSIYFLGDAVSGTSGPTALVGYQLFRSDSNGNNATAVNDLAPNMGSAGVHSIAALDGKLYFTVANANNVYESDGTAAGTTAVGSFNTRAYDLAASADRIFASVAATIPSQGNFLYETSPAAVGMTKVGLTVADAQGVVGDLFTAADGTVYFAGGIASVTRIINGNFESAYNPPASADGGNTPSGAYNDNGTGTLRRSIQIVDGQLHYHIDYFADFGNRPSFDALLAPAAGSTLGSVTNKILTLYTTAGDDLVKIAANSTANTINVSVNGFTQIYDAATLTGIGVSGGDGFDRIVVDSSVSLPVTLSGGAGNDTIIGGSGADSIYGNDGNDFIDAGAGNDSISGGTGNDTLAGGDGADTITGDDGDDLINGGAGSDILSGGAGDNTLDYSSASSNIATGVRTVSGTPTAVIISGNGDVDTFPSFDRLICTDFADNISLTNYIYVDGRGSDDVITDVCRYVAGATVHGGDGNDRITLTNDTNPDYNTKSAVTQYNIIDGNDAYGANTLYGDAGNDTLTGNGDVYGGDGVDTVDLSSFGIARPYEYSSGRWRDQGSHPGIGVHVTLDDIANDGTFSHGNAHSDIEAVIGTPENDSITGSDVGVTLIGNGGNDYIRGGAGNDSLVAGVGKSVIYGSTSHDTIVAGSGDRIVEYESGPITTTTGGTTGGTSGGSAGGGTGTTAIRATVDLNGDGLLTINGGTSSVGIDVSSHANGIINVVLNGVSHHFPTSVAKRLIIRSESLTGEMIRQLSNLPATILGSPGNDSITSHGPSTVIHAGAGNDEIYLAVGSNTVYGDEGNDTLMGGSGVDRLYGGDGNDYIDGGTGNDILYGQAGNDHLFGNSGIDHLDGGAGSNLLRGGDGKDTISYLITDDIHANAGDRLEIDSIVK